MNSSIVFQARSKCGYFGLFRPLLVCLGLLFSAFAQAQTAARIYEFNGSYADTNGGAAMVSGGGTLGSTGYSFAVGQGPNVSNALANTGEYSIEMVVRIDGMTGSFQNLINFNNRTNDISIYSYGGSLYLFPYPSGLSSSVDFVSGQTYRIIITRSASSKVTTAYVNGLQRVQVTDTDNNFVASAAGGILHFFRDDGSENASGFIDQIRIYHSVLTPAQVAALSWQAVVNAGNPTVTRYTPAAGSSPVAIDVGSFAAGSARSFEFVFNAAGAGPSRTLLGSRASASGVQALKLNQYNNTGKFGLTTIGVADYVFTNSPTRSNQQVHAVYTSNGAVTTLYLNGVAQSATVNEGLKITGRNGLGALEGTTQLVFDDNLDGTITGFASYARALTQAEVTARYNALAGIAPNTPPVVAVTAPASVSTAEGSAPAKTGTFSDANGNATVTVSASAGTISQNNAAGTWSWTGPVAADGPASSTVTITATDTAGAVATTSFTSTITNVGPVVTITAPASANEDTVVNFSFTATDVSSADQAAGFFWFINYGNGQGTSISGGTASPLALTYTYPNPGIYTIIATARDKDSGDSIAASKTITITSPALPPEINLKANGNSIADGELVPSTAKFTRFGTVSATSLARIFTIENTGGGPLVVSSIAVAGENASEFAVSGAPTSIAAGASATFTVTYTPSSGVGTSRAIVTVNSNDADEVAYDFVVEGEKAYPFTNPVWTGRTAAEANPWNSIAFGNGRFVAVADTGANRVMTSPNGVTWTARIAPLASWRSVAYGKGLFVAVANSDANRLMTSPDGITWTQRTPPSGDAWAAVTYGNGLFVAVAQNSTGVMTSTDGITWTARTGTQANSWISVTYGNGLFVAVSANGTNRVMTSPDGISWTARNAAEANSWSSVAYGNGMFVAVAYTGGSNLIMTSPDGITWTPVVAPQLASWKTIAYGNGRFVALADSGTNRVMTSPDGAVWTAGVAAQANPWAGIAYGQGRFVAVTTLGTQRVMTYAPLACELDLSGNSTPIPDGDKFPSPAKHTIFGPVAPSLARTFTIQNPGLDVLAVSSISVSGEAASEFTVSGAPASVAPGSSATFSVSYTPTGAFVLSRATVTIASNDPDEASYDFVVEGEKAYPASGTSWIARSAPEANPWVSVAYGNGRFVAVANNGVNRVMTSPNGLVWTARSAAEANPWVSVAYGNGLFVAVATGGTNRIMTSPDGVSWTARPAPEANQWSCVTYGDGLFVAVSNTGTNRVMTSPDGVTWTARAAAQPNPWQAVARGNGLFVAVASSGDSCVMTSPDGITWTPRSITDVGWNGIAYGNGRFVAVSYSGTQRVATSVDGVTWSTPTTPATADWNFVAYGNGLFVVVGTGATDRILTSPDGVTWTVRASSGTNYLNGVAYGDGRFVAVCLEGTNRIVTALPAVPEITVLGNGTAIADGARPPSPANHTQFGAVATSLARTFTISNDGGSPLTISSITITGDQAGEFALSGAPSSLASGASAALTVTYTPTTGVAISRATVTVNNNDPDEAAYDFAIEGEKSYPFTNPVWTSRTPAEANTWVAVAYGNGLYVALSINGTNRVMTSPDGATWTARSAPEANVWSAVTYGKGLYVAVSAGGTNQVMTSPDGVTWTARPFGLTLGFRSVTFGNGQFVGVGTDGIATSPDGISWTARTSPAQNQWYSVTHGNDLFVAVSRDGTNRIMTSPDGVTWTARLAPAANPWNSVTYGKGLFVAVASSGTQRVMTSPDGLTWTARNATELNTWFSVVYGNGLFTAVATSGVNQTMTSPDGLTWTALASTGNSSWSAVAYGDGRFVSVAGSGTQRVMALAPFVNSAPVVTLTGANPFVFEAAATYADPGATATDPDAGALTPTITGNSVQPTVPGTYAVTWSATDVLGLAGTATRTVQVVDTTPPVISAQADIAVSPVAPAGTIVTFPAPTATDLVGVASVGVSHPSGSLFPLGDTTVTITAQDTSGNISTRTFTVRVVGFELAGLAPSVGALSPAFNKSVGVYDLVVPEATGTLTLTPSAGPDSVVTINGSPAVSGVPFGPIPLAPLMTFIEIVSGKADGSETYRYTLRVARGQVAFLDAIQKDGSGTLTSQGYTASGALGLYWSPLFSSSGDDLTLINNTGPDLIQGAFTNLAQGQAISVFVPSTPGGSGDVTLSYVVDYHGGTGNDLVLRWARTWSLGWGNNSGSQLGFNEPIGSPNYVARPGLVPAPATGPLYRRTVFQQASGANHALALLSDGTLVQWGMINNQRQAPQAIPATGALAGKRVATIAAGLFHSLALCTDGTLVAWGANAFGQLGNNTTTASSVPVAIHGFGHLSGRRVTGIAAGSNHSLALLSDGTVAAWGYNGLGQLGDGTTTSRSLPVAVVATGALVGKTVSALSAGEYHTLALLTDGTLAAWGGNGFGQLGIGSTVAQNSPVALPATGALAGKKVTAIVCGGQHSLALTDSHTVLAWGRNEHGQLGFGFATPTTTAPHTAPALVDYDFTNLSSARIRTISAGARHSFMQDRDGKVFAWGANNLGQLGLNDNTQRVRPTLQQPLSGPVGSSRYTSNSPVSGSSSEFAFATHRAVGWETDLYALKSTYGVLNSALSVDVPFHIPSLSLNPTPFIPSTGLTLLGQPLAAGAFSPRFKIKDLPLDAQDVPVANIVATAETGETQTHPVKIQGSSKLVIVPPANVHPVDGYFTGWGRNDYAQRTVPSHLLDVVAISAGLYHNIALRANGAVAAWGITNGVNYFGQTAVPADLAGVTAVATAFNHNLALKSDGTVVAWGANADGQCNVPAGLGQVKAVSAGFRHSAALKTDGTVVAWGSNASGELSIPAGLTNVVAIDAGDAHTLALRADGTVVAWGSNADGQVNVPAGLTGVTAVTAGGQFSAALKADGTVVVWGGTNTWGNVAPDENLGGLVAIASGSGHLVGLKGDGSIVAWGYNVDGQAGASGLNDVRAIVAGGNHTLAIRKSYPAVLLGSRPVGTSGAPLAFTLRNVGNRRVDVGSLIVYSTPAGEFAASGHLAGYLEPGDSRTISVTFTPSTTGRRTATLRLFQNPPALPSFFDVELVATGLDAPASPAAAVADWAASQGLSGTAALPTAAPFGDGVPNLLKYAFNMPLDGPRSNSLNPAAGPGANGLPVFTVNTAGPNPTFTAQFLRRRNSGLTYVPQRATSLTSFTPMLAPQVVTPIDADWELVTVAEPLGTPLPSTFFSRVEVTLP